jgi:hypothetical protein
MKKPEYTLKAENIFLEAKKELKVSDIEIYELGMQKIRNLIAKENNTDKVDFLLRVKASFMLMYGKSS